MSLLKHFFMTPRKIPEKADHKAKTETVQIETVNTHISLSLPKNTATGDYRWMTHWEI